MPLLKISGTTRVRFLLYVHVGLGSGLSHTYPRQYSSGLFRILWIRGILHDDGDQWQHSHWVSRVEVHRLVNRILYIYIYIFSVANVNSGFTFRLLFSRLTGHYLRCTNKEQKGRGHYGATSGSHRRPRVLTTGGGVSFLLFVFTDRILVKPMSKK